MMCGYVNYQDPRLIPPDINDPDEPMDVRCFEDCTHGEACRSLLARYRGWDANEDEAYWADKLTDDLGCENCELWEDV